MCDCIPPNNFQCALDALPSIQSEPWPSVWWVWHVIYVSMSAGMALPGLSSCHSDLSWSPIDYYPGSRDLPGDQSQASIQVTWPVWTNHSWLTPPGPHELPGVTVMTGHDWSQSSHHLTSPLRASDWPTVRPLIGHRVPRAHDGAKSDKATFRHFFLIEAIVNQIFSHCLHAPCLLS